MIQNRLKELRKLRDLTQDEVSRVLGISYSTVCKHETGDRGLTELDIKAYAKLFRVETYEIFMTPAEVGMDGISQDLEIPQTAA